MTVSIFGNFRRLQGLCYGCGGGYTTTDLISDVFSAAWNIGYSETL